MTKSYRHKVFTTYVTKVGGQRVSFEGGYKAPFFKGGLLVTSDPKVQKEIESRSDFGKLIFLVVINAH
jgi:hypothetical protein